MIKESIQKWLDDMRGHGALRAKAWKLLHAGKYEEAGQIVEIGQKRFSGSISFEILRARYSLLADERELAACLLDKIENLPTRDVFDQFELAETFRLMGKYPEAIGLLENLRTNDRPSLAILASHRLSSMYCRIEQPENALASTVDVIRLGGNQTQLMTVQLGSNCSSEFVEKAIADVQTVRHKGRLKEARRLRFIAFLAASIGQWEFAIESVIKATKQRFLAGNDASLWDDSLPPLRPGVLVIGAMKSGTTSLFRQLISHPQFVTPLDKELQFFIHRDWPDEFYFQQFPRVVDSTPPMMTGEASPGYYTFDIVDRVKQMLPETKIAFIRRNPVERAISHYFHNRRSYLEEHPAEVLTDGMDSVLDLLTLNDERLGDALREIEMERMPINRYLMMGCYDRLMRRWRAAYPREQILELEFSDFTSSHQKTMDQLFGFLGLNSHQVDESFSANTGRYKHDSAGFSKIKKQLTDFYAKVNQES